METLKNMLTTEMTYEQQQVAWYEFFNQTLPE